MSQTQNAYFKYFSVQCFDMPQPINGATFIYSPPNANSPFPIGTTATLVCANGTQLSDGSTVVKKFKNIFIPFKIKGWPVSYVYVYGLVKTPI